MLGCGGKWHKLLDIMPIYHYSLMLGYSLKTHITLTAQSHFDSQSLPVPIVTTSVLLGVDIEEVSHPALTISVPQ